MKRICVFMFLFSIALSGTEPKQSVVATEVIESKNNLVENKSFFNKTVRTVGGCYLALIGLGAVVGGVAAPYKAREILEGDFYVPQYIMLSLAGASLGAFAGLFSPIIGASYLLSCITKGNAEILDSSEDFDE